ncbi:SagB family peptide dehydrogenase [Streptomyces sp. GMY02]|uniref:SagB family peptide dehydrogenase n=1 Tax=Streptomyces sp. GMY02 TaxID=1333528 RepID=UPI001C2C3251|nr:SagB family peptide dehydrogenase [Streptomyces sp. GMY02]QXE33067.1 SagB family peptide dehydrogenase [Streptomyces sp. GMY02]
MGYAHDYAAAIMQRGRIPMEPADFVPDWADRPRKAKYYPGIGAFPLPETDFPDDATVAAGCLPPAASTAGGGPGQPGNSQVPSGDRPFTLDALSGMLRDSYGLTGRRLGVQTNTDLAALPHYTQANWSRGTASGGGLYPVSVYWISGPSGPATPGVHYYSAPHHTMQRLVAGDVTGEVRAALDDGAAGADCDQFLVLGIKYWQNAFKYNSFSFHAVSMDLGAILQTWRIWARARGLEVEPLLWFDEQRLSHVLGVDNAEEGVFAVVPLTWQGTRPTAPALPAPPAARYSDSERSRRILRFETLERIHAATAEGATDRPAPGALAPATTVPPAGTGVTVALPEPALPPVSVRTALRARRSSFGRFDASTPLTTAQLAATLSACAAASLGSDAERPAAPGGGPGRDLPAVPGLVTLYAFVSHAEGVEPGAYAYDPAAHELRLVVPGAPGPFLQRNYFLSNYNLEQAGAVLVPTIRTHAVLGAVGDRGYRLVNGTIGAVAQTFYTAASALGLGAGVALGFDNISYIEELGLDRTGEKPLLIMLLGNERARPADFRYEIA